MRGNDQCSNTVACETLCVLFGGTREPMWALAVHDSCPESFQCDITMIKGREVLLNQCKQSTEEYLNALISVRNQSVTHKKN